MPIIINGGSYCAGGWWSNHLQKAETNERVEIVGFNNLSADSITDAFREMEALAAGTRCKNYFYQANINPRADERLTPAQRDQAVDTLEKNLGLTGQPRFVVEHQKEGRTHWHVIWSRIDTETQRAISDSLTAAIHERTSRELEIKFDLERGQSVLTPNRETDRERRPPKSETFRAAETGVDLLTVKADAQAARQQADNGQSFKAALEASGDYVLARGDRRDFVIVDRNGDDHSLARRLGMKAAELRSFMADLDPASLPSVAEAKAQQAERAEARVGVGEPSQSPEVARMVERLNEQPEIARRTQENIEAVKSAKHERRETAATIENVTAKVADIASAVVEKMAAPLEGITNLLGNMFAPAPAPTRDEAERAAASAKEDREARERAAPQQAWDDARGREADEAVRQQQNRQQENYSRYGWFTDQPNEPEETRSHDRGRERERDRD